MCAKVEEHGPGLTYLHCQCLTNDTKQIVAMSNRHEAGLGRVKGRWGQEQEADGKGKETRGFSDR